MHVAARALRLFLNSHVYLYTEYFRFSISSLRFYLTIYGIGTFIKVFYWTRSNLSFEIPESWIDCSDTTSLGDCSCPNPRGHQLGLDSLSESFTNESPFAEQTCDKLLKTHRICRFRSPTLSGSPGPFDIVFHLYEHILDSDESVRFFYVRPFFLFFFSFNLALFLSTSESDEVIIMIANLRSFYESFTFLVSVVSFFFFFFCR